MLSLHRLARLVDTPDPTRLWAELDGHGLTWPLPLRVALADAPAAAWALALRRVCELTHGPTPLTRQLTARLLELQQTHGTWTRVPDPDRDPVGEDDVLTTALAVAALHRRLREPGADRREDHAQLQLAHDAGLAALAALQDPADGLFASAGRPFEHRVAEGCFVLFLLAEDPAFAGHIRLLPLRDAVEQRSDRFDPTLREVFAMAELLLDRPDQTTDPARPALAA